jgi:hypothetical protein
MERTFKIDLTLYSNGFLIAAWKIVSFMAQLWYTCIQVWRDYQRQAMIRGTWILSRMTKWSIPIRSLRNFSRRARGVLMFDSIRMMLVAKKPGPYPRRDAWSRMSSTLRISRVLVLPGASRLEPETIMTASPSFT